MATVTGAETRADRQLGIVTHWIGGKSWEGTVERWGDVFNPSTGERGARVARRDDREYWSVFEGGATPPSGMPRSEGGY